MLLLLIALQDVLVEEFDKPPLRDGSPPGWTRASESKLYNTIDLVDGAIRLRSFGGPVALRHRGVDADPRLSYRVSAALTVTARSSRAWVALRWLDRDGRALRTDAATEVETPPDGAARVQLELHLDGPDVRSEARFDTIRLTATPRIELRPVGRTWPVWRTRDRIEIAVVAQEETGGRILHADGVLVRTMAQARNILSTDPLPAGAYRLQAGIREIWIYVLGAPIFDTEPEIGVVFRKPVADPAAIADLAGARHVAVAVPAAESLVAPLSRRHDTLITAIGAPTREQRRAYLQQVDYWVTSLPTDRWVEAEAPTPELFALRTRNDLLSGALPTTAPSWARDGRAWTKRGRTIVEVTPDVKPPSRWLVVEPLRGSRTIYLVSPP